MTDNLQRRYKEHQKKTSHFTSYNSPIRILYTEEFDNKSEALKREKQLKGRTRAKKEALIKNDLLSLKNLSKSKL